MPRRFNKNTLIAKQIKKRNKHFKHSLKPVLWPPPIEINESNISIHYFIPMREKPVGLGGWELVNCFFTSTWGKKGREQTGKRKYVAFIKGWKECPLLTGRKVAPFPCNTQISQLYADNLTVGTRNTLNPTSWKAYFFSFSIFF